MSRFDFVRAVAGRPRRITSRETLDEARRAAQKLVGAHPRIERGVATGADGTTKVFASPELLALLFPGGLR